jgi:adenylate cyclase
LRRYVGEIIVHLIFKGIPEKTPDQELKTVIVGKRMVQIVKSVSVQNNVDLQMRIGVHCGSAFAGILGEEKYIFGKK